LTVQLLSDVRQNTLWSRGARGSCVRRLLAEALKKDPPAALLSVLDGSGSLMGGKIRFGLAVSEP